MSAPATTSSFNTAHGALALYSNTTGANNTAIGDSALYTNVEGFKIPPLDMRFSVHRCQEHRRWCLCARF